MVGPVKLPKHTGDAISRTAARSLRGLLRFARRLAGEPAIENGQLRGGDAFVESYAHSKTRADVDDSGQQIEFLAIVSEFDAHDSAGGSGIECVDITAGPADIAGTGGKTRTRGDLDDLHGEDERLATCVAAILHNACNIPLQLRPYVNSRNPERPGKRRRDVPRLE